METEARYTLVGSVVLGLCMLAVGIYFWYHFAGKREAQSYYKVFFKEQSLAGLESGGTVTMRGIKVGTVRSIRILANEQQGVEVILTVPANLPVRTTTAAAIDRNLLTGIASIDLRSTGPQNAPLVREAQNPIELFGDIKGYVIDEGNLPIQEITKNIEDIVKNLDETLIQVRTVFSQDNQESISAILSNLESLTASFAGKGGELSDLQLKAANLLDDASTVLKSLDASLNSALTGVNSMTESLQYGAASAFESVQITSDRMLSLVEDLEEPGKVIFGVDEQNLGPGERLP